jgi:hypothetical protein
MEHISTVIRRPNAMISRWASMPIELQEEIVDIVKNHLREKFDKAEAWEVDCVIEKAIGYGYFEEAKDMQNDLSTDTANRQAKDDAIRENEGRKVA